MVPCDFVAVPGEPSQTEINGSSERQCHVASQQPPFVMQVAAQTKPDLIIFVMDGSIGQAAHDQAKAFKDTVEVCAILRTSFVPLPPRRCLAIFVRLEGHFLKARADIGIAEGRNSLLQHVGSSKSGLHAVATL